MYLQQHDPAELGRLRDAMHVGLTIAGLIESDSSESDAALRVGLILMRLTEYLPLSIYEYLRACTCIVAFYIVNLHPALSRSVSESPIGLREVSQLRRATRNA